jgi:predicted methyltransferase MtxX (methanogen marker protein 4)
VGLDSEDLDDLQDQITIAISNSNTLKSALNEAKFGVINSIRETQLPEDIEDKDNQ